MWDRLDPRKPENWKLPKMHWGFWLLIVGVALYFGTKLLARLVGN